MKEKLKTKEQVQQTRLNVSE